MTKYFVTVISIFCLSCASTLAQRRLVQDTLCAIATETCMSDRLPESEIRRFACSVVLTACANGTIPDTSGYMMEVRGGALRGILPGIFRCPTGERCNLASCAANFWNSEFQRIFGEGTPDIALLGPTGWITISEDNLPPHVKGSSQEVDHSNAGLLRGPTLLGYTDYSYADGWIYSAHITLQIGEWRDIDLHHEAGHALFGLRNQQRLLGRSIMSLPPHKGDSLTRSMGFAILEHCIIGR
jgi:hypothetical protein